MTKNKQDIKNSQLPSAVDDCADVKSKFDRFKRKKKHDRFTPVSYEKPPHF